jgi:hypothetical protein
MPDWPLVAVQVVNYRTRRYLERCVDTVVSDLEGSSMAFEINLLDRFLFPDTRPDRGF